MISYDPRDVQVRTLVGQVDPLGIVVLCALARMFPEPVKAARLTFMCRIGDDRKTLQPVLNTLEICGYATRTGSRQSETWHITDLGRSTLYSLIASTAASTAPLPSGAQPAQPIALLLPGLETVGIKNGENLSAPSRSSSSSILIDQLDRSIDLEEEENGAEKISAESAEAARVAAVTRWCDLNAVTGEKRSGVLADRWCTVERLSAWLDEMRHRGETNLIKFRNKYGPLNYAITCCLHHDEPPDRYAEYKAHSGATRAEDAEEDQDEIVELPQARAETPPAVALDEPEKISVPQRLSLAEFQRALRLAVQRRNAEWSQWYGEYIQVLRIDGSTLVISIQRSVEATFNQARPALLHLAQTIDPDLSEIEFAIY